MCIALASGTKRGFRGYGEAGQTYVLKGTEDLVSKDWKTVRSIAGANATISLTDDIDKTNAFYRVYLGE